MTLNESPAVTVQPPVIERNILGGTFAERALLMWQCTAYEVKGTGPDGQAWVGSVDYWPWDAEKNGGPWFGRLYYGGMDAAQKGFETSLSAKRWVAEQLGERGVL